MVVAACLLGGGLLHHSAADISAMVGQDITTVQRTGSVVLTLMCLVMANLFRRSVRCEVKGAVQDFKKTVDQAKAPVGEGGAKVSVEDMKTGGTGGSAAVNGVTVTMETVRARYIVNAAGSYSDRIAKMIGDDSFTIKPRLGDYMLLNRNQGFAPPLPIPTPCTTLNFSTYVDHWAP